MDLDDEELKATRKLHGVDKMSVKTASDYLDSLITHSDYLDSLITQIRDFEDNYLSSIRTQKEFIKGKEEGFQEAVSIFVSMLLNEKNNQYLKEHPEENPFDTDSDIIQQAEKKKG